MSFDPRSFLDSLPPHMRPKAVLLPKEASQEAHKIKKELFKSWYRLKTVVLAHEDTIQKRWKKVRTPFRLCTTRQIMSAVQRTAIDPVAFQCVGKYHETYGPPPVFSIDALADLLEPQYELAVQHLADLRADPVYLA